VSVSTKAGDGQLRIDGKHATEFGACLVEPAEVRQCDDFDPHRSDQARMLVQGAVLPFDRLFKAPRGEVGDGDRMGGVERGKWIERAQAARPFDGLDRRLRLVAKRVDIPSGQLGVSRIRVER
jgi:hypothetical protein